MRIQSLKQVVEAVFALVRPKRIILLGSSALFPFSQGKREVADIIEKSLDVDMLVEPSEESRIAVAAEAVGEQSLFHREYGIYADFMRPEIAETFPGGWERRCVTLDGYPGVKCMHPRDIAVMKLVLGREKDVQVLVSLIRAGLVALEDLRKAYREMDLDEKSLFKVSGTLHRLDKACGGTSSAVPKIVKEKKGCYKVSKLPVRGKRGRPTPEAGKPCK